VGAIFQVARAQVIQPELYRPQLAAVLLQLVQCQFCLFQPAGGQLYPNDAPCWAVQGNLQDGTATATSQVHENAAAVQGQVPEATSDKCNARHSRKPPALELHSTTP
jgi:hypothetical protein